MSDPRAIPAAPVVGVEQLAAAMHDTYWQDERYMWADFDGSLECDWWRDLAAALLGGGVEPTAEGLAAFHANHALDEGFPLTSFGSGDEGVVALRGHVARVARALLNHTESSRFDSSPVESGSGTGAGTGAGEGPVPATPELSYGEILQWLAGLVDGMPTPWITVYDHYRGLDLSFHRHEPAQVRAWAALLGFPAPTYTEVRVGTGRHGLYRNLTTVGKHGGFDIGISGFIDVDVDSTGLEGTGWLEQVWVATGRRSVQAHRPTDRHSADHADDEPAPLMTACDRSMRTGERTTARQAADRWDVSWSCRRCWPNGSPITAGGAS